VLAYAIGGAIVGAACYLGLIPFDPDTVQFHGIVRRHMEIMTGAGIVAGLVYWLIAGRTAGAWREPPRPLPPPTDIAPVETIPAEPVAIAPDDKSAVFATPQPAPPPQNTIEAIAVTVEAGRVLVRLRHAKPLTAAPAEFVVATPPRIVFDFPHTVTGLGRHHDVGGGDLQSVDVIEGESRTRLILILRNQMRHEITLDRNELLITLTPATRSGN
jgi:hypothetical protein